MIPPTATATDDRDTLAMLSTAQRSVSPQLPGIGNTQTAGIERARRKAFEQQFEDALSAEQGGGAGGAAGAPASGDGQDLTGLAAYAPDPTTAGGMHGLDALAANNLPPHSIEREGTDMSGEDVHLARAAAAPADEPDDITDVTDEADVTDVGAADRLGLVLTGNRYDAEALSAIYGTGFPLAAVASGSDEPTEDAWVSWAESSWARFHQAKTLILWQVDRLRLMRAGIQWTSSVAGGPWREPPKPRDAARITDNHIAPALDYRLEIVSEQRPGFKTRPINQDQRTLKRAEAQQVAVDYQYDQQRMRDVIREAEFWAGTDGVAFTESYWDPDRGPWDEVLVEAGPAGSGNVQQAQLPKGDPDTCVHRIEEVSVSPDATATRRPNLWIIRKQIPLSEAVATYGPRVLTGTMGLDADITGATLPASLNRLLMPVPDIDELKRTTELVDTYVVYGERTSYLPRGLMLKVVGKAVVLEAQPLLYGRVPMVRWTDGSSDPAFFCKPIAYEWIGTQQRINALESKLIENIRLQSGAKLLAKREALSSETLTAGNMTVFEVKTGGPLRDAVQEITGTSVGIDVMNALTMYIRRFEQFSGWNDSARGSVSPTQSGRAILANREALERVFAPTVNAAANAMGDWAEIQVAIMKWGYDEPRMLAVQGASRPDLVREVGADDFDGVAQVTVDPETLMPLPRSLRLYLLEDMYAKGLISGAEYRRRLPFGFVANLDTPDTDHYARAKRACEAIRQTLNPNPSQCPILWMDNPAIHQDVLERELILPDDLDPRIRAAAYERWIQYAIIGQLQGMQTLQGGPSPQIGPPNGMGAPAAPAQPQGGAPAPGHSADHQAGPGASQRLLPPGQQPFQGTSPGVPAATASAMGGGTAEHAAGRMADVTSHQP